MGINYDCKPSWQYDTKAQTPLSKNIMYMQFELLTFREIITASMFRIQKRIMEKNEHPVGFTFMAVKPKRLLCVGQAPWLKHGAPAKYEKSK